jgi:hypothetical protein
MSAFVITTTFKRAVVTPAVTQPETPAQTPVPPTAVGGVVATPPHVTLRHGRPDMDAALQEAAITIHRRNGIVRRDLEGFQTTGADRYQHYCMLVALVQEAKRQHLATATADTATEVEKSHDNDDPEEDPHEDQQEQQEREMEMKLYTQLLRRIRQLLVIPPSSTSVSEEEVHGGADPYVAALALVQSCRLFGAKIQ